MFSTRPGPRSVDVALGAVRVALAWIFVYYGAAGKLFGAFNGPGLHNTALFFSNTAHLHPGGFFAVLGGVMTNLAARSPWRWDFARDSPGSRCSVIR